MREVPISEAKRMYGPVFTPGRRWQLYLSPLVWLRSERFLPGSGLAGVVLVQQLLPLLRNKGFQPVHPDLQQFGTTLVAEIYEIPQVTVYSHHPVEYV